MSDVNWNNNAIQFPRLLAEIIATQDKLNMQELADSMDLSVEDLDELFERAQQEWERIKAGYSARVRLGDWNVELSPLGKYLYIDRVGSPGDIHVKAEDEGFVVDVLDKNGDVQATLAACYNDLEVEDEATNAELTPGETQGRCEREEIDVYARGWGWDVFGVGPDTFAIERCDEHCFPEFLDEARTQRNPYYMTDETAEWLVLLLAEDGDHDAISALYPTPGYDTVNFSRY